MSVNGISGVRKDYVRPIDVQNKKNNPIAKRQAYGMPKNMTIDTAGSYYPNISRLTPEELFDIQYESGTKLSDGAVLVRPVILSLGDVDITPLEESKQLYKVDINPSEYNGMRSAATITMTEEELLSDKTLCGGTIKKEEEGNYTLQFRTLDGEIDLIETDKAGCLKTLKENLLYI